MTNIKIKPECCCNPTPVKVYIGSFDWSIKSDTESIYYKNRENLRIIAIPCCAYMEIKVKFPNIEPQIGY